MMQLIPVGVRLLTAPAVLMIAAAGPVNATQVDKLFFGTLENGGSFSGSFAGDTGVDDILSDNELTSFTFSSTNVNDGTTTLLDGSADLSDVQGGFFFAFGYSETTNAFTTGPEFFAAPLGYGPSFNTTPLNFEVGATPIFFDDNADAVTVEVLSLTIVDVPEPGSLALLASAGLLCCRRRNRSVR